VSRVRIALAHSQRIVLEGLGALLRTDPTFDIVWSGISSEALLEAVFRLAPDVAFLELEMPKLTGFEVARRVRMAESKTELLLFGERRGSALPQAVEQAGALTYVSSDAPPEMLFDAIRAAADHRPFAAIGRISSPEWKEKVGLEALSARELDVLRCLTDGLSSREIAEQLSLSFRTVDGYRASLMDKLFIRTIPGLVKFAIRHRLTDLDR